MKANAPERLYLSKNIYSTYLYQVPDPDDETAIEYTHTDAFIEKACDWIEDHIYEYLKMNRTWNDPDYDTKLIRDFRKYMKGE